MSEMRPHVSMIRSRIFLLGLLIAGSTATAETSCELSSYCADVLPFETSRLAVRFLELEDTGRIDIDYKDADGREDEEEGNDEIDIVLMTSPAPDGAETVDAFVRVRQPGILLVDSEEAPLRGSLEPIGTRRPVAYTDADGNLIAPVWPGDYSLRVESSVEYLAPALLRFRLYILSVNE